MTKVRRIESRDLLEDAASMWVARLEADDVSEEDRQRFAAWLDKSPQHRETFEAMRHTWHRLDALGMFADETAAAGQDANTIRARSQRTGTAWAAAASVLLMITAAAWWQLRTPLTLEYETAIGHQLSVSLEDGSTVDLNTNTLVEVNYTDGKRTVNLQRGEAHFAVAKDPARPFVVLAGSGAVRAVGTQFNVYLNDKREVEVTVTEGTVEVTKAGEVRGGSSQATPMPAASEPARLSEGQRIYYDRQFGAVAEVPAPEVERDLAWRHGMLSFDGETLEEVVAEVSRYTNIRFVIADPNLRELKVGGYFKSTDIDALTELLDTAFAVEARRDGQQIVLTRRTR